MYSAEMVSVIKKKWHDLSVSVTIHYSFYQIVVLSVFLNGFDSKDTVN